MEAYQTGLCVWNDATENFELVRVLWTKSAAEPKPPPVPDGHPVLLKGAEGQAWVLFGNPLPTLRCPATFECWQDPATWEILKPQESLLPVGSSLNPHISYEISGLIGSLIELARVDSGPEALKQAVVNPTRFGLNRLRRKEKDPGFSPGFDAAVPT